MNDDGRLVLSQNDIDFFATNGYLPLGKILEDEEIELLREEYDHEFELGRAGKRDFRNIAIEDTDDLETKNRAKKQMLQIMQMCERNIQFRKLLFNDRILDVVEDLIGPNIQLFHDQALFKPPRHGAQVTWHQDNGYWKCAPASLVSCWITLDDVDADNGAMQFKPGSHLKPVGHGKVEDSALLESEVDTDADDIKVVPLPAGGAAIHHCQTLHHTEPNTTDRQRRAFAMHYMVPGTRSLRTGEYLSVGFARPLLRGRI